MTKAKRAPPGKSAWGHPYASTLALEGKRSVNFVLTEAPAAVLEELEKEWSARAARDVFVRLLLDTAEKRKLNVDQLVAKRREQRAPAKLKGEGK